MTWRGIFRWLGRKDLPAIECPSTQAVGKKRKEAHATIHRLLQAEVFDATGNLYPIPGGNNG